MRRSYAVAITIVSVLGSLFLSQKKHISLLGLTDLPMIHKKKTFETSANNLESFVDGGPPTQAGKTWFRMFRQVAEIQKTQTQQYTI